MSYIVRRLLLVFPTLFGILLVNFFLINLAPGGPVDQILHQMQKIEAKETSSQSGSMALATTTPLQSSIEEIEKEFGLDKPLWERFFIMARQYLQFDFGKSYFSKEPVIEMVKQRLPVSISLGLWSSLLIYLISIPLGIRKAVRHGSPFDTITSFMMMVGYAIPSFLFALLLIIFFAGGSFFSFFPLRGLVSSNWDQLSFGKKILDYLWHMALPLTTQVVGSFASLSFLTKNAFLEEISKQYVTAARAQGFTERHVLFRHVFRNAMLVVLAGLPATLMQIFFSGSILIETIFSLDGLGMMGYEAVLRRDYPVIFGSLYLFTLMGLLLHILSDLLYTWIDPRIHFGRRSSK